MRSCAMTSLTMEPGVAGGAPMLKKPPISRARESATLPFPAHAFVSSDWTFTRARIIVMGPGSAKGSDQLNEVKLTFDVSPQVRCIRCRPPPLMKRARSDSCQRAGSSGLSLNLS